MCLISTPKTWVCSHKYNFAAGRTFLGVRSSDLGVLKMTWHGSAVKNPSAKQKTQVWSLGPDYPLEEEMATHCIILDWRIPWREEPGGLTSIMSPRDGHDWSSLAYGTSTELILYKWEITDKLCWCPEAYVNCLSQNLSTDLKKNHEIYKEFKVTHDLCL